MDISRRGVISLIGAGLGSVGLTGVTQMNNQTSTPNGSQSETEQGEGDGDGETDDDQNENENENENKDESEDENEDGNDGNVGTVDLSQQEAEQIATQEVGGGTVQETELEIEDDSQSSGTPVYAVVVKTTSSMSKEVMLNANTGDVLSVEDEA